MIEKEMSQKRDKLPSEGEEEKTLTKSLGFGAHALGSNVATINTKNGKIIRIRPLHYDSKYRPEEFRPWKIEARGKVFKPTMKSLISPFSLSYKKRVDSPNRILYPLKRVDFDPKGDRHIENRGKSKFVRISWDEALEIVAGEIKRVQEKYGPHGILLMVGNHGETKVVHMTHGASTQLLHLMGGYTLQLTNPDSWEGWFWGAKHVWGMPPGSRGVMRPQTNVIKDVSEHSDMVLFWGCDPETTSWGFWGQQASRICYWLSDLGIKSIYICPDLNYGAAVHADKWIPILPNTDAALHLAIAYIWVTEGRYDKEYVATHTFGFDKFEEYVLGKEDGTPKTPDWASPLCGVPVWTIKALAREFATKVTSIAHVLGGSYIRSAYAHEPGRLEVLLLAMQGLGKPGVHQVHITEDPHPGPIVQPNIRAAYRERETLATTPEDNQYIWKSVIPEAILNPPLSWYGTAQVAPNEDQFVKGGYPADGCSEVHMIWTDAPCFMSCWNGGNKMMEAYKSPKIEFILAQHPWMENDCLFADIILPVNTKFEEEDIGVEFKTGQFDIIFPEGKCIEPLGESKSDYEIVCLIAEKLGLLEEYTEGKTVQEWIKFGFDTSGVQDMISWKELNEKGYFVIPTDPDWKTDRAGLIDFYKDPEKNPLMTPTGKLEFYSTALAKNFPDDDERPPVPHWIPYGETHQESRLHPRAKKYPLLIVSNHPRWRVHSEHDDVTWLREIPTCKVKGPDGYYYEPVWINPVDAAKRGIKNGDVITVYNERGGVLGGAYVTERIMPGVVYQDHGARYDPIISGELDRGGSNNTICPTNITSRNCAGQVTSGYLVEVESTDLDELKKKYPEAFNRPYHPTAGIRSEAWIEGK
jgi:trimethylamine-N-oxide reductase (cytochrome c)